MRSGNAVGRANEIGTAWGAAVYEGNYGTQQRPSPMHARPNIAPLRVIPLSLREDKRPQPLKEGTSCSAALPLHAKHSRK
jgi:hypothetical protein